VPGILDFAAIKREWPEVLKELAKASRSTWVLAQTISVVGYEDGILGLEFISQLELDTFKKAPNGPASLRQAIQNVLGVAPQFKPHVAAGSSVPAHAAASAFPANNAMPAPGPAFDLPEQEAPVPVVKAPAVEPTPAEKPASAAESAAGAAPEAKTKPAKKTETATSMGQVHKGASYGEPLLREILGAKPVDDTKGGR